MHREMDRFKIMALHDGNNNLLWTATDILQIKSSHPKTLMIKFGIHINSN